MKTWDKPEIRSLDVSKTFSRYVVPNDALCATWHNAGPASGIDKVCKHSNANDGPIHNVQNIPGTRYCRYVSGHEQPTGVDRQCLGVISGDGTSS